MVKRTLETIDGVEYALVEVKGKKVKVPNEDIKIAEKHGVSYRIIQRRLYRGWSVKDAVLPKILYTNSKAEVVDGVLYRIIKAGDKTYRISDEDLKKAEDNGVSKDSLVSRLRNGNYTLEQALTYPKGKRTIAKKYDIDGRRMTMEEIAKEGFISLATVKYRIKHGYKGLEILKGKEKIN